MEPCPYCYPVEHINQACKSVYKHEHMGYPTGEYPCDKPWTALCQTAHGDICYSVDCRYQSEAVSALLEHLRRAECISPGAGDRLPVETCRTHDPAPAGVSAAPTTRDRPIGPAGAHQTSTTAKDVA